MIYNSLLLDSTITETYRHLNFQDVGSDSRTLRQDVQFLALERVYDRRVERHHPPQKYGTYCAALHDLQRMDISGIISTNPFRKGY